MLKYKVIAVDLDETILYSTKESYPNVLFVNKEAIEILKDYKNKGGKIIIWTLRTDEHLKIALKAIDETGLKYDAVNSNLQESIDEWESKFPNMSYSPKVKYDLCIDDRNFPCNIIGIDWKLLHKELLKEV